MTTQFDTASYLASRLETALSVASRSSAQIVAVTVPAPVVTPALVLGLRCDPVAYYFAAGDNGGDVGFGAAITLDEENTGDLSALEVKGQALLEQALELGIDAAAKAPRFYGGVAFDRSPAKAGPWGAFGHFSFVVPRFRYVTDGQRASVTLHVLTPEIASSAEQRNWVHELEQLVAGLAAVPAAGALPAVRRRSELPSATRWLDQVRGALVAMRDGLLEKVVLAREVIVEFDEAPSVSRILENLNAFSPETTRFALRRGKSIFLGATPERLILRSGSELRTEAVAGSIRALDSDGAVQLMQSEKERHEHELVVREVVRKLELLGARVEVNRRPAVRQLRHVLHLASPITARLFGPPHILTILGRLHPTPAVGGVPEQEARVFMRQAEDFERGWYAAPIGWFDAQGDGEFVVGLRSGLLSENLLRLYAGAGIVRASVPEQEFQETELKLQSMLEAIGSPESPRASVCPNLPHLTVP